MILLIVFLPLLAAIVAGLGNKQLGATPAKVITTGALFVSCVLSWPIFLGFMTGAETLHITPVLEWIASGDMNVAWSLRVDAGRFRRGCVELQPLLRLLLAGKQTMLGLREDVADELDQGGEPAIRCEIGNP